MLRNHERILLWRDTIPTQSGAVSNLDKKDVMRDAASLEGIFRFGS